MSMSAGTFHHWLLAQEARALLTRLDRVKPFILYETMVPAAALSNSAQAAIDGHLALGRNKLRSLVHAYLAWLQGAEGKAASPDVAQRRFSFLRLQFNATLTQFDIFSDAITQRSEHDTGVWLAGLDVLAQDALALRGGYYVAPEVVCYLDRGVGAAIRRACTRLPGGGENPVAVIQIPRERMVGSGVASSLVHEIGHQAAALLDLVTSLRTALRQQRGNVWRYFERWISEIIADFWSVARVGVTSTLGLMGVVSLPRAFVFRMQLDDPHPFPWIRVKISCAMGAALYPHRQWSQLAELWNAFYPSDSLNAEGRELIGELEQAIPTFVGLLLHHRPKALRGRSLVETLEIGERQPARLASLFDSWHYSPQRMRAAAPSLACAVIGQAKMDGKLPPEQESKLLAGLLTHWATRRVLSPSASCTPSPRVRAAAPVT